ncbi:MAG: hypothetical protein AB1486_15025 [Planctomycetota bacterium]
MRSRRRFPLPLALVLPPLLSACMISESVSVSASQILGLASNSIKSISNSITGGGQAGAPRDIKAYAVLCAQENTNEVEFLRGIGRIARQHGITHWEAEPHLLVAAGEGLRSGGMSEDDMERFGARLAARDETTAQWVLQGYTLEGYGGRAQ